MKKISIIVPIYKVENYIVDCINSVLSQDYKNFELILVDDGSPDNSGSICDKYQKKDKRIKVIHKSNGGLSDARNAGIKEASGDYLMFIDGDDFLYSYKNLKKIAELINKYNSDIIQYKMIYLYGDKYVEQRSIPNINKYNNKMQIMSQLNKEGRISVSACDKIIKRDIIINNKLFFEKGLLSEDVKWSYNLYFYIDSIKVLDESIYVYRQQRIGSITTNKNIKHINDLYQIVKYWLNHEYKNTEIKNLYYNMIAYWYLILRTTFPSKYYSNEIKTFFKDTDKYIFDYNDNYKVKKAYKIKKIFGVKITIIVLKIYNFLKNKGIIKI